MKMTSSDQLALLNSERNGRHYDSTSNTSSTQIDSNKLAIQRDNSICSLRISRFQLAIVLAVATGLVNACVLIVSVIYGMVMVRVGSDPYIQITVYNFSCFFAFTVVIVIRWMRTRELPLLPTTRCYLLTVSMGFLGTLYGVLLSYAMLPFRTRPELAGILLAADLPFTVICRYIVLRKAVGVKRLLCAAAISVGLFVSLIPEIFKLESKNKVDTRHDGRNDYLNSTYPLTAYETNQSSVHSDSTVVYSWIWPTILVLATVPISLSRVISEQLIKTPEVSYVTLVFWSEVFHCASLLAFFWMALIPNFGMSSSIGEFLSFLQRGLHCTYIPDPSCHGSFVPGILFTLLSPCIDSLLVLLTKYADGAIYTTIVITTFKPISTIFWTLFKDTDLRGLIWLPEFNISTILAFVGLFILVPAMCLYAYFANNEEKPKESEETRRSG